MVLAFECPRHRCTATISPPFASDQDANEWRNECSETSGVSSAASAISRKALVGASSLNGTPPVVRKDEALVEILSGLGCKLLGLRGLYTLENCNGIAIERHLAALSRFCALEDDGSGAGNAFCLLRPRRCERRANGQRRSIQIDGIPFQADKLAPPRAAQRGDA